MPHRRPNHDLRKRLEALAETEHWSADDWHEWGAEWRAFDALALDLETDGKPERPDFVSASGNGRQARHIIDWSGHAPIFMALEGLTRKLRIQPLPL
jgi:hypothetical protein